MIVLAITTLWVAGTRSKAAAQAIVHDPTHMAGNAVGFTESLREALNSTAQLMSLLGATEKSLKYMQEADKRLKQITLTARTAAAVYNAVYALHGVAKQTISITKELKYAYSSGIVSHDEAVNVIRTTTTFLSQTTVIAEALMSLTTGLEEMTSLERGYELEKWADSTEKVTNKVNEFQNDLRERLNWRNQLNKTVDSTIKNPSSPDAVLSLLGQMASIAPIDSNMKSVPIPTVVLAKRINDVFDEMTMKARQNKKQSNYTGGRGTGSSNGWGTKSTKKFYTTAQVNREYKEKFGGLGNVFFAISAVVGLLGAIQVYRKYQIESADLTKSIAIWSSSTLLIFFLGLMFGF